MATIAVTVEDSGAGHMTYKWEGITENDEGAAVEHPNMADKSVQVGLTGGAAFGGGNIPIEGSLNGTDWVTLTDPQGNALTFTAAGLEQITEAVRYIRPGSPTGTSVDLDVMIHCRIS